MLVLLKVFKWLFNDHKPESKFMKKTKNTFTKHDIEHEQRHRREEEFLMQLWYLLNPLCNKDRIKGNVIAAFLKTVYDPYLDTDQESINMMVSAAAKLV